MFFLDTDNWITCAYGLVMKWTQAVLWLLQHYIEKRKLLKVSGRLLFSVQRGNPLTFRGRVNSPEGEHSWAPQSAGPCICFLLSKRRPLPHEIGVDSIRRPRWLNSGFKAALLKCGNLDPTLEKYDIADSLWKNFCNISCAAHLSSHFEVASMFNKWLTLVGVSSIKWQANY